VHRSRVVARQELVLLVRDPLPLVLLLAVPLVFIAFLKPAAFLALIVEGYPGTNGAEQAVPGAATTFSLFAVGLVGLSFFREHGWGTWPRLRAAASVSEVFVGKVAPLVAFALLQLGFLFAAGILAFGLRVRGSLGALALFCLPVAIASVALGLLLVGLVRTLPQLNACANLAAAVLAGMGGALMPLRLLPGWVRTVAPASPAYWAMRGFRSVLLDGGGMRALLLPGAVLSAFAALFFVVSLGFFKQRRRLGWG